jgi:deazaflavin-dependent oxidoreductase (nitroreductase family)
MEKQMKSQQSLLDRMRFLNKRIFNPVIIKFAGSRYSPISIIRHTGRRSGKSYRTPVIVEPVGNQFIIALPYGSDVDWYRNILAARWGSILWRGKEYLVENPEPLAVGTDLSLLPLVLRVIVQSVGVQYFIQMRS